MGINEEIKKIVDDRLSEYDQTGAERLLALESNVRQLIRRGHNEPTGVLAQEDARNTACALATKLQEFTRVRDAALKERDALNDMVTTRWLEACEARKQSEASLRGKAVAEHERAQANAKAEALEARLNQTAKERDTARWQLQKSEELCESRRGDLYECHRKVADANRQIDKLKEALKVIYLREVPDLDLGVTVARWMREVAHEAVQDLEKQHGL